MKKYKWIASSDDGSFKDESRQAFTSKEECYNDMRNSALEKIKLSTEYTEAFNDHESIGYGITFYQEKITHASYKSSVCTYEIKEIEEMKTIELTDEQRLMIAEAIINMIYDIKETQREMNKSQYDGIERIAKNRASMTEYKLKYKTLLDYIQQV